MLLTQPDGQRLLLAGQKSGVMYGMSPETGAIQWESRIADGGALGGIEWGFATDGMVYVNSGYATFGFMLANVLLAFSVEGQ